MTTALDLDHRAGFLEGYGPISPFRSRLLLPAASLQRLLVDADTGVPLGIGPEPPHPAVGAPDRADASAVAEAAQLVRDRLLAMVRPATVSEHAEPGRSPSAALARFLRARDLGCVGPGCPRHARSCELDHDVEVSRGGPTASWNLDCKSSRCHHARHEGWQVQRLDDGTVTWLSPAGQLLVRRSPWRPPHHPREGTVLPPPRLESADGGKSRSDWYAEPAPDLDARFDPRHRPASRPSPGTTAFTQPPDTLLESWPGAPL